jgi:transposase
VLKGDPDWEWIHNRLKSDKNQNLQFIWEGYRESNPEGLGYSQFCRRYNDWKNESGKNVVMVQEREPGKELFVDWMGDTLDCVADSATGKLLTAHFFVATLGDSSYPYVEAFPDEKLDKWLSAHVHALEWVGGTPRVIVPDNCKTAVHRPQYYDPVINQAYWDLACHYGVAIIPARIREPQDKAPVESSVRWLETWAAGVAAGEALVQLRCTECDNPGTAAGAGQTSIPETGGIEGDRFRRGRPAGAQAASATAV